MFKYKKNDLKGIRSNLHEYARVTGLLERL